jgi:hypothetical protein
MDRPLADMAKELKRSCCKPDAGPLAGEPY